jgi:hypothetical protein
MGEDALKMWANQPLLIFHERNCIGKGSNNYLNSSLGKTMVKEEDTNQRCHCSHQRSQNDTSSTFRVESCKGEGSEQLQIKY